MNCALTDIRLCIILLHEPFSYLHSIEIPQSEILIS